MARAEVREKRLGLTKLSEDDNGNSDSTIAARDTPGMVALVHWWHGGTHGKRTAPKLRG